MDLKSLIAKMTAIEEGEQVSMTSPSDQILTGSSVDECGDMPMPGAMAHGDPKQQDNVTMNISMNGSGSGGIRDLMDILRNLEDGPGQQEPEEIELAFGETVPGDNATTEPSPEVFPMAAAIPTGDDLASKGEERPKVNGGGNPLRVESIKADLTSLYEQIKSRDTVNELGVNLTQPRTSWAHKGPAEYDDKANATAMSAKYDAMIKSTQQELAQEKANPRSSPNHIKYLEDQIKGLEKEKMHNMFVAMPDDATNALRKQAIANNELTPGQWLQKATQYFKGKITGKDQPGVEYDRVDTSKQLKPGWKTPTPYKPEAVPMKESNEIIKLSKMLNG